MKPKISIVMTYYNRPRQLKRTLETIALSKLRNELEIVLVDDGSVEGRRAEPILKSSGIVYKHFYIPKERKTWFNPCCGYNLGFKNAEGRVVIIQNAEVFHVGDVIDHSFKRTGEKYLVYSCKNLKEKESAAFQRVTTASGDFYDKVEKFKLHANGWYNHPKYNPRGYHFLSSISKKNLDALGGFDERYAGGYCFDDDEFFARIKRSPFEVAFIPPEQCFGVHQWHTSSLPSGGNKDPLWKRNSNLFRSVTLKEIKWSVAGQETKL